MFIFAFLSLFVIPSYAETRIDDRATEADDGGWGLFLSASKEIQALPDYDIGQWVQQLHLQQCAVVEIGEGFCALFVELRSIPSNADIPDSSGVGEFFLGLCSCATLRSWTLCSEELTERRQSDCTFTEAVAAANTSARVHRRLCDATLLSQKAPPCNCSLPMAGQQLYRTQGFPTCFRNPLPESLCSPRGVCGVARCSGTTIRSIHSPQCDPECHEKQPFCEELGPWTSSPPQIVAQWSRWSSPVCNNSCGEGFMVATAVCRNQVTGKPAIDCIGPGSFWDVTWRKTVCPEASEACICHVTMRNGVMTATRALDACRSTEGCKSEKGQHLFETVDPERKESQDERYEETDHLDQDNLEESMEYLSNLEYEEPFSPVLRRLLASDYTSADYESWYQRKRSAVDDEDDDDSEDEDSDDEDEDADFAEIDKDNLDITEQRDLHEYGGSDDLGLHGWPEKDDELEGPEDFSHPRRVVRRERRRSHSKKEDCDDGKTERPQYVEYDATDFSQSKEGSDEYTDDFSSPRENTQTIASPAHLKWHLSSYLCLKYLS